MASSSNVKSQTFFRCMNATGSYSLCLHGLITRERSVRSRFWRGPRPDCTVLFLSQGPFQNHQIGCCGVAVWVTGGRIGIKRNDKKLAVRRKRYHYSSAWLVVPSMLLRPSVCLRTPFLVPLVAGFSGPINAGFWRHAQRRMKRPGPPSTADMNPSPNSTTQP